MARGSADRVADTGVQSWVICARPIERLEAVGLTAHLLLEGWPPPRS